MWARKLGQSRGVFPIGGVTLVFAGALAFVTGCSKPESTSIDAVDPPKRVIWIAIDSLRADHLGVHGYDRDTTPWLDDLAQRSVTFDWALSPSNETLVSVAAYFGGQPVSTMLPVEAPMGVPAETVTLAEHLHEAGVHTRALTANPKILPQFGYAQGFDEYEIFTTPGSVRSSLDEIIGRLRDSYRPSGAREFIYIHTMDVHHPYRPPNPFASMFTTPYTGRHVREGSLVENDRVTLARSTHPYWSEAHDVQPGDIEFLVALYDGAIRYTDDRLPELLDALEWDPNRDVLILSSDHGEHFMEMGWWTHFATLTPMEIRVPLIIHYAGLAPRRVEQPVGLIDLYATILDLFDVTDQEFAHTKSLGSVLRGDDVGLREVYAETQPRHGLSAALIDSKHWYWMSGNRTTIAPWHAWPYEEYLFDYRGDPRATNNLVVDRLDAALAMNARLRELYPRWAKFESASIAGDDNSVEFGPNLLAPEKFESAAPAPVSHDADGSWRVDSTQVPLHVRVENLTPYEPLYLSVPYELESGAIHLRFAPSEYALPSRSRVSEAWTFTCLKPTTELRTVGATVVPTADTAVLEIRFAPGTRAVVSDPSLQRMMIDRVERWPRFLHEGPDTITLTPEEEERLRTLGYLGN
jgi:arylsulfatase